MNSDFDQARAIAERVARRLADHRDGGPSSTEVGAEIGKVRANIDELQQRLSQLEAGGTRAAANQQPHRQFASHLDLYEQSLAPTPTTPFTHSPWLAGVNAVPSHPSEERFGVEEATINELVDFFQSEKTCSLDPSGKPCDHCAMCSSRGF